jgi:hypothetical protein
MRAWIESRGGTLAIVHIGDANFAMPDVWADFSRRHHFPRDYARQRFAGWSAANHIAFADAIDPLQEHFVAAGGRRDALLLEVDGHYNAQGQRVIADVFHELIERERLLPE